MYLCTNIKIKTVFTGTYPEPAVSPLHKKLVVPLTLPQTILNIQQDHYILSW